MDEVEKYKKEMKILKDLYAICKEYWDKLDNVSDLKIKRIFIGIYAKENDVRLHKNIYLID